MTPCQRNDARRKDVELANRPIHGERIVHSANVGVSSRFVGRAPSLAAAGTEGAADRNMSALGHHGDASTMASMRDDGADVPHHPLIGDAFARAVLDALVDSDSLGIALLRGRPWVHAMVNATYQRIVGRTPALGRTVASILPPILASDSFLDRVQST